MPRRFSFLLVSVFSNFFFCFFLSILTFDFPIRVFRFSISCYLQIPINTYMRLYVNEVNPSGFMCIIHIDLCIFSFTKVLKIDFASAFYEFQMRAMRVCAYLFLAPCWCIFPTYINDNFPPFFAGNY